MTLGIAFSGGGIIALLASSCTLNWLDQEFPGLFGKGSDVVLSTVSGGTLGQALVANAGDRLWFPRYNPHVSLADAKSTPSTPSRPDWFGKIALAMKPTAMLHDSPGGPEPIDLKQSEVQHGVAEKWRSSTAHLAEQYGIEQIRPGNNRWYANFMYAVKSRAPVMTNKYHWMNDPRGTIGMGFREMQSGAVYPPGAKVGPLDAMAWSSAFWAARPLLSYPSTAHMNRLMFEMEMRGEPQDDQYFFADGGMIDGTGITTVLRDQPTSVLAFYNSIGDYTKKSWGIKMLFGVDDHQVVSNILGGPKFTQIFPSHLADEVFANLTNPKILRARLDNVPVLRNDWLGIKPYILKTLLIFANGYSAEFVDSFADPSIKPSLSKNFPTGFTGGMAPLDANLFCMFQSWRADRYKDEIDDIVYGSVHTNSRRN